MNGIPGKAPDLHCPPGSRMTLDVAGLPDRLITACVGYAKGRFVVVHLPFLPEAGREAIFQMLYPDNHVIVRFLYEGTVMGFDAQVIKYLLVPFPLLFLSYPTQVEALDLRKHRRIPCLVPGEANIGPLVLPGMVVDLSLSGCQFSTNLMKKQVPKVGIDDMVELRCDLFGTTRDSRLSCAVKRVGRTDTRLDLGLKFREVSQEAKTSLLGYLQNALAVLG